MNGVSSPNSTKQRMIKGPWSGPMLSWLSDTAGSVFGGLGRGIADTIGKLIPGRGKKQDQDGLSHGPLVQFNWRDQLQDLASYNASIKLMIADSFADLTERAEFRDVRVLAVRRGKGIIVECPPSFRGRAVFPRGSNLVGRVDRGYARWAFMTRVQRAFRYRLNAKTTVQAIMLAWPERVLNEQQRQFYRALIEEPAWLTQKRREEEAERDPKKAATPAEQDDRPRLPEPEVAIAPLLDVESCIPVEIANEEMWQPRNTLAVDDQPIATPEIGDVFPARVIDISAGGMQLEVSSVYESWYRDHQEFWLHVLLPDADRPLLIAAKLAHVYAMDGSDANEIEIRVVKTEDGWDRQDVPKRIRFGLQFLFDHNPIHSDFIIEKISAFTISAEREELKQGVFRGH